MAFSKYALCNKGLSIDELVTIRSSALTEMVSGKVTTSVSGPGISTTSEVVITPAELFEAATTALQQLTGSFGNAPVTRVIGYTV